MRIFEFFCLIFNVAFADFFTSFTTDILNVGPTFCLCPPMCLSGLVPMIGCALGEMIVIIACRITQSLAANASLWAHTHCTQAITHKSTVPSMQAITHKSTAPRTQAIARTSTVPSTQAITCTSTAPCIQAITRTSTAPCTQAITRTSTAPDTYATRCHDAPTTRCPVHPRFGRSRSHSTPSAHKSVVSCVVVVKTQLAATYTKHVVELVATDLYDRKCLLLAKAISFPLLPKGKTAFNDGRRRRVVPFAQNCSSALAIS